MYTLTIIVAAKKEFNGKTYTVIGSDSRLTVREEIIESKKSKLIKFPTFIVGFSGLANIKLVLQDCARDPDFLNSPYLHLNSASDARVLASVFFQELSKRYEEAFDDPTNETFIELVVASKDRIFHCDCFGDAHEFDRFITSGGGSNYATGYLEGCWDSVDNPGDLAHLVYEAIEVACARSTSCGGEIHVELVVEDNLPPVPPLPEQEPEPEVKNELRDQIVMLVEKLLNGLN